MKTVFVAGAAGVFSAIVSLSVAGYAQAARTPSAVAYVSPNRVLAESIHGRSEAARLQGLQQQRSNDLRAKQQALEATRQQLASADGAARMELAQKENQQRQEFERTAQQAQLDFQNLQREINTDLARRVKTALDDIMKTQNYQLVVNADTTLLWFNPELDLTAAVVGRLNGQ